MSRFFKRTATALALVATACMADSPTNVSDDLLDGAFDISDGANGGFVDGFFWLTPTVKKGPKNFSGTFDPNFLTLNPTIEICKINGTAGDGSDACISPTLYTLSTSTHPEIIRIDAAAENYSVTWQNTNGSSFMPNMTYRAVLSVGGVTLGWVDLKAVAKQKDLKKVGNGFSGFVVGSNFLFKFRVETGIAGQVVVTPPGQMIFDANTPNESANFTATVTDLYNVPLPGATVDWISSDPNTADVVAMSTGPTDGLGQSSNTVSSDGLTPVLSETDVTITATVGAASGSEDLLVKPSLGTLKVIKNADADGTFDFTGTGAIGGFQITTTGAPSSTGSHTKNDLLVTATYDVTETLNPDFDFQGASCVLEGGGATGTPGGTGVTGIVVEPAMTTTCTFENTIKPSFLTLSKTVINDDGGTAVVNDFQGKIDGGNVPWFVAQSVGAGSFTASETVVAGYAAGAWGGDCAADGTITLAPGDSKTCTITNDDQPATLTLIKTVINDDGGTAVVNDFQAMIDGGNVPWGVAQSIGAGAFTASETVVTGYTAGAWGGDCAANGDVTLALGDSKVCTITNDDQPATLTLNKTVVNDDGGTAVVNDFQAKIDGGNVPWAVAQSVGAGSFTASETVVAGYAAGAWGGDCAADGTVTLALGDAKTCTITNDDQPATLTLAKTVVNDDGGTAVVNDFQGKIDGGNVPWFVAQSVGAGSFTASETVVAGYAAGAWGGDCAADGTITLAPGDAKTCTITNDDQPATLTLNKTVVNDDGGTAVVNDFQAKIDGGNVPWGVAQSVGAGAFTASETVVAGYAAGAWGGDCAANGDVTLALGDNKTCTITNDDVPPDDAPTVVSTTPTDAATDVVLGTNITIDFDESVNATTSSFTVECAAPGNLQAYALSASPASSFTLNPNADLPASTLCTVTVIAAQVTDADAIDPPDNMAGDFVFSFTTTDPPVDAVDDNYTATGNIAIAIPDGAIDVIDANDVAPPGSFISEVQGAGVNVGSATATTGGGSVTMLANGSFTYEPPVGYQGADDFTYTLSNAGATSTDIATVNLTVIDMIWFVDDSSPNNPGTGTFNDPFRDLSSASGPPSAPGHTISVATGTHTTGIVLQANQTLLGQGVQLDLYFAADPLSSAAYQAYAGSAGTAPLIATGSGNGIDLAAGNTIRGLNIVSAGGGTGISGNIFGTLTVSEVSVSGTGQALDLANGALAATFDELSASMTGGANAAIRLTGVSGSLTEDATGTLSRDQRVVEIVGSSLNFTYNGAISGGGGFGGILLQNNSGTFNFGGQLTLSSSGQQAFRAAGGGGTVNVTGSGNTLTTANTEALVVTNMTIGSSGMTFQSISSDGGLKGIIVQNAGSGGLTVTGTGATNGSGGTIQNKGQRGVEVFGTDNVSISNMALINAGTTNGPVCTGLDNSGCHAAISLNDVTGATFNNVDISGTIAQQGINGLNVTDFTLGAGSIINGAGDNVNEGGVRLFNLDGTVLVDGTFINASSERNFFVTNNFGSAKTLNMTVQNTTMNNTGATFGADGLEVELLNNTTMDLNVTGSVFSGNRTNGIQVISAGNSVATSVNILASQIDPGAGLGKAIDLNTNNTGTMNFNITGNDKLWADGGTTINVTAFVGSSIMGRINGNTDIRTSVNGNTGGHGVAVSAEEQADIVIEIDGNTIDVNGNDNGIQAIARADLNAGTAGRLDATINNNNVSFTGGFTVFPLYGVETRAQEANTVCGNVTNNTITADASTFHTSDFRARTSAAASTLLLQGYTGTASATWTANGNTGPLGVSESQNGTHAAGTCTTVSHAP